MPINHQPVWLILARAIRIGSRALAVTPSFEPITAAWGVMNCPKIGSYRPGLHVYCASSSVRLEKSVLPPPPTLHEFASPQLQHQSKDPTLQGPEWLFAGSGVTPKG